MIQADDQAREWLRQQGVSEDELADVASDTDLMRLATDMVVHRGVHLSAADIGVRLGVDPQRVAWTFRGLGVAVPDVDTVMFTDLDVRVVEGWEGHSIADSADGEALMRVVANALDRVADAGVALYVQSNEKRLADEFGEEVCLPWLQEAVHMTEVAEEMGVSLGVLFRHHLKQAIDRQRVSQSGVTSRDVAWQAVGFVDLSGSTAMTEHLDAGELRKVVNEFESRSFEVAASHGGRVVKFIGDEIMVAALSPAAGCRLMLALVEACSTTGMQPRGGLAWGEVLYRGGDYYGREVNLASRLVDAAIPGEVLVDASVVDAGSDAAADLAFDPAGRRMLKGFADPVTVWTVSQP